MGKKEGEILMDIRTGMKEVWEKQGGKCVNGGREGTMETKMEVIEAQTGVLGEGFFSLKGRRRKKKPKIGEFEEKGEEEKEDFVSK